MSVESGEGLVGHDDPGISTELEVLADEGGPGYAAYLAPSRHVRLTAPVRMLLASCREDGRSPILVTGAEATLSPLLVTSMRLSGGYWVVRTDDGVYDGLSGSRITAFSEFRTAREHEEHPAYAQVPRPEHAAILVEVTASRRAEAQTLIGPLAEAVVTALGGAAPDRWGLEEPLSRSLDHRALTDSVRSQMPQAEPHLLGSPDGSYAAVSVARTSHGLLERVRAGIPVGALGEVPHDDLVRGVGDVFLQLQQHAQIVVAFGSVAPVVDLGRGQAQRPGAREQEMPLAVLLGPRATHDLHLDVPALQDRFDLTTTGRARTPSVLLRTPGDQPWRTLHEFTTTLGDRLATALGVDEDFVARMRQDPRTSGGPTG